jgi:phosphate transport system substrate-binding protein
MNKGITMKRFSITTIMLILLVIVMVAGGSIKGQAATGTEKLKGTIRISGAWALYPMMVKWAEEFKKLNPNIRIDISAGGAGKGAADALAGMVDIGMVSREIRPEEIQQGIFAVPVVKDAVFPTININNPVLNVLMKKGIKKNVFINLWIMGKPLSWGNIAGTSAPEKVQVYTRSDSCGAAETGLYIWERCKRTSRGLPYMVTPE